MNFLIIRIVLVLRQPWFSDVWHPSVPFFRQFSFTSSSNSTSFDSLDSHHEETVTVGDEFPSISIGFINNRTEYEIKLDTSGHVCDAPHRCEVFVTLTEMFCKHNSTSSEQPYIEIAGTTSDEHEVHVRWCRDYGINEDFAQDEFLKMSQALLTPRGDWTKANATVLMMASFYTQLPLQTETIEVGSSSVEVVIDSDQVQYEFTLDENACPEYGYHHCSLGAYMEINCFDSSKLSSGLQLDVVTMNNQTVSRVLCPLKCADPSLGQETMSTYLLNMKKLSVKPTGSWKSPLMIGRLTLGLLLGSNATDCGGDFFDCDEGCIPGSNESEQNILETNGDTVKMRCVPWSWICKEQGKYCENYCDSVQKFCSKPESITMKNGTAEEQNRTITSVWVGHVITLSCRLYLLFFFIPLALILLMFFGTVFLLRRRQVAVELEEQKEVHHTRQSLRLLGKIPRSIPYQMVENPLYNGMMSDGTNAEEVQLNQYKMDDFQFGI